MTWLVIVFSLGAAALGWHLMTNRREVPIPSLGTCARCGKARELLDEALDDLHLDAEQRRHEQSGAVDYHVWWCGSCEEGAVVRNTAFQQTWSPCTACGARATFNVHTVAPANERKGGELRVEVTCPGCGHVDSHRRYTPRVLPRG
ncbi:hypothetical protein ACN47A_32215 [Myxococcus fulvus]|uniref:hypothetical protein n=1 Tax=Myxococcus fulvus TaxID=33 RepID=UPI003B9A06F3